MKCCTMLKKIFSSQFAFQPWNKDIQEPNIGPDALES